METESSIQTIEIKRFQCRHIFTDGHRCGSPALRSEDFCYFHHASRKVVDPYVLAARATTLQIAVPEDRAALLVTIGEVLQRIVSRNIDRKDASLLLYGLQIASSALPREPHTGTGPARANSRTQPRFGTRNQAAPGDSEKLAPVEDAVFDKAFGMVAQPAEFLEPEEKEGRKSLARRLLDEVEAYEERQYEFQQKEAHAKEIETAVQAARAEAFEQAAAEAYANLEELVDATRAAAITETEARVRAEFNQTPLAIVPVIQAFAGSQPPAASSIAPLPLAPCGINQPPHRACVPPSTPRIPRRSLLCCGTTSPKLLQRRKRYTYAPTSTTTADRTGLGI